MKETPPPPSSEHTSVLLRQLIADLPEQGSVDLDTIVRQMRRRSFGGILIILSMLSLVPGISFLAGLAVIVPAAQIAAGLRAPVLPRFMRRRRVSVSAVRTVCRSLIPWSERLERFIRPRLLFISSPPGSTVVGVVMVGLALAVMLPLPFSNLPPAVALICIALGLVQRDGAMILAGLALAVLALSASVLVVSLASDALLTFIDGFVD